MGKDTDTLKIKFDPQNKGKKVVITIESESHITFGQLVTALKEVLYEIMDGDNPKGPRGNG